MCYLACWHTSLKRITVCAGLPKCLCMHAECPHACPLDTCCRHLLQQELTRRCLVSFSSWAHDTVQTYHQMGVLFACRSSTFLLAKQCCTALSIGSMNTLCGRKQAGLLRTRVAYNVRSANILTCLRRRYIAGGGRTQCSWRARAHVAADSSGLGREGLVPGALQGTSPLTCGAPRPECAFTRAQRALV